MYPLNTFANWCRLAFAGYPRFVYPLPKLADRKGRMTSSAGPAAGGPNKTRLTHKGDDWFYPRLPTDPTDGPNGFGDGKGTSNGKWLVPWGSVAIAVCNGRIREQNFGRIRTGLRFWLHHDHDDHRTGYMHMAELFVAPGQVVLAGQVVGVIGDNPNDKDARHLHTEVSPQDRYAPIYPQRYFRKMGAVHAPVREMPWAA